MSDSKPHIRLDIELLKKFPPDGCDIYAWSHYVLPLVEQLESAQREVERLNEWLLSILNFTGKGHVGWMAESAVVDGLTLKEAYELNPASERRS